MPEHTADLLSCWIRRGGSKSQKRWWKIIPHCIWWSVWNERNSRSFEDRSNFIYTVKWNCIISYYFCCKKMDIDELEIVDLLGSLYVVSLLFLPISLLKVASISLMLKNTGEMWQTCKSFTIFNKYQIRIYFSKVKPIHLPHAYKNLFSKLFSTQETREMWQTCKSLGYHHCLISYK